MDELKKEVGKRLAEIRKNKKLNQEEFKNLIGAPTVQMISGWENGHSFPSPNYLIIIAKKLDISLDYLLLGHQKSPEDKSIKTYKDAATYIIELVTSGLFEISGYRNESNKNYHTMLSSSINIIGRFREELDTLLNASKVIRPELLKQAYIDLINKYDIPIKK